MTNIDLTVYCTTNYFQVIDHYENPRNVGKLDAKKRNVGTGLVGAPACGDVMKLQESRSATTNFLQYFWTNRFMSQYPICHIIW